jgi:iron(III) transport system ATP-binding protein
MYINLSHIKFEYNRHQLILDELSINLKRKEIVAILGSSGSGKSTLLRLISGLEKPIEGSIEIDGLIVYDEKHFIDPHQRNVGMVFQDYALFPHLTVFQNIAYGIHKKTKTDKKFIVNQMLELTNLLEKKDNYPHELSGGQQQRVALARALAPKPKVLLLDEPFSNLDHELKKQIRNDLKLIMEKQEMTCIFATHDYEDAIDIADRILYLENGKIIKEEKIDKDTFK